MKVDNKKVEKAVRDLLIAIGENPDREGLLETPARVARFYQELESKKNQPRIATSFESTGVDQMVVISDMRVWSLCEHHMLPFYADITIAYLPKKKVLGLSKFGRISHLHASGLQVQERLVQEIAKSVSNYAETPDVAVVAEGEHLCMTMRGVRTPAKMKSSVLLGNFRTNEVVRQEFLSLLKK